MVILLGQGKTKVALLREDGLVEKRPKEGKTCQEAQLLVQASRLNSLRSMGFNTPEIHSASEECVVMERIEGETLRQIGQLSEGQLQGLVDLQALQSAMGIYIGDLNGQNLIWSKGSWWIVDCGSVRQGRSPKYIEEKLALRWSKWFPEA